MALRVLLADENVTIKKVIQLSLQDYAVSVKSVNLGVDVLDIARGFRPDIVFADVLLQKRNGYEVCSDFKNDPELSKIPFILMWSGFMELDQQRFRECGADGQLEKPFDKDTLRALIQQMVTETQSNELSPFIETPPLPKMELQNLKIEEKPAPRAPSPSVAAESGSWNMDSFDDIGEFVQKPLSALGQESPGTKRPGPAETAAETWKQKDLSHLKLPLPEEDLLSSPKEYSINYDVADDVPSDFFSPKKSTPPPREEQQPVRAATPPPQKISPLPTLSEEQIEQLLRAQSREIIESVAWKIVPELAEKIIREKLDQLMRDAEL